MTTNISKVETRRRRRKKPQIIENIIPWLFFPSRKPHSKTDSKKEIKTCTDSYSVMPSIIFGLSPPSSFPSLSPIETDTNHKEEPRRSSHSILVFIFPMTGQKKEKKKFVAATLNVYTQIFTYYIFIFGVQQQQRQTKEEEKKDDIPLPSCCQIAIGEIETQPTDQTPDGKEERKRQGKR
jgi:hypothetical protein